MQERVAEQLPSLYDYILQEENNYRTERVPLASNWRDWNMYEHVDRSYQLKNSKFYTGVQDFSRPFFNMILPIANVNYRTEGFDVKDVQIYVDDPSNFHKSFMARKFHNWWAKENHIDTAIDESVESYFDYGLALVRNINEVRPEVIQLQQIAFCDQSDIMSGPICLKHYLSIPELQEMGGRWEKGAVEKAVLIAKTTQKVDQANDDSLKTPSKYTEVYDLEGMLPESWLGPEKMGEDWEDTGKYTYARFMVTFYQLPNETTKNGIVLFKGKAEPSYKALVRDPIHGRACGRGGIEELFHPQIWGNWTMYQIKEILQATAEMFWVTDDKKFKNQKISALKKGTVLDLAEGTRFESRQMQAVNKGQFDQFLNMLEQNARAIGSASDPQLGLNPSSGTPLGTTEIVTQQGQGVHEYRRGKIADFWAEIYREWGLKHFVSEINRGSKWLDELSLSELQMIAENVATQEANRRIKRMVLAGRIPNRDEADAFRSIIREEFMKGGDKRFLEVFKDEFRDLPLDVEIDIAGKQEALFETVSKLNSVFRAVFNPQGMAVLQANPAAQELLNDILEKSGLRPVNFAQQPMTSPQGMPMQSQSQGQELVLTQ